MSSAIPYYVQVVLPMLPLLTKSGTSSSAGAHPLDPSVVLSWMGGSRVFGLSGAKAGFNFSFPFIGLTWISRAAPTRMSPS